MTPFRWFLAGILAAMTAAAVIHGDLLWLLFQSATGAICLSAGMVIGRLRRLDEDAAYVRWLHSGSHS